MKTYVVDISMKWSLELEVKANSKKEAKEKAYKKIKKSDFEFEVYEK